jgi:hypothetical protein
VVEVLGVRRIAVGTFGALARAGLEDLLSGADVEAHDYLDEDLLGGLPEPVPDVVLLDLDRPGTPELADRISRAAPTLTVIACSGSRPLMRVYPPFHTGESYERELDAGSLATECAAGRLPGSPRQA